MDTNHPAFQQPAPEFLDPPEDVLIERIAKRWAKCPDLDKRQALEIVKVEATGFLYERPETGTAGGKRILMLLSYILDSSTPLVQLDVAAYAYGLLQRNGISMHDVASRHGISRQAFSIKVQSAQKTFNLSPHSGMRPTAQRRIYQEVHRERWGDIEQDAPKAKAS